MTVCATKILLYCGWLPTPLKLLVARKDGVGCELQDYLKGNMEKISKDKSKLK